MSVTIENWATEPCERHLLTCCADCLKLARMRRNQDGELRYSKDCAVETFAEITGLAYPDALEIMLEAGYVIGRGTYRAATIAAFESAGCVVREVTHSMGRDAI